MNQSRTVKKYIVFLGLTFFLFPLSLQASSVKVLTSFDKRTVSVDDKITMSIKVVGVGAANLQRPRLPQFEDFLTHYEGRSSNFSFVEGNSVRTVTFKYVLIPQKVGDFTISPFDVSVEGATYRTAPIAIKVISLQHTQPIGTTTAQTAAVSSQHTQPSPVSSPLPTVPQHKKTLPKGNDENLFVQIVPDKAEVYPYEQLTITYIMYTRRNLRYEGFEKEPETLGFWVEDLTDKEKLVREEVSLEGRNYMKAEVRKLALFPTRSGEFTIKPTVVKCSVQITDKKDEKIDDFFKDNFFGNVMTRREERLLETPSLDITVLPFPKENKPLGFKGMSGDYRMNVALDKKRSKQNDPVTMTITIEGAGNIETIERPLIGEAKDFTVYDGTSSTHIIKEGGIVQGKKTFEVMFLPKKAGMLNIPPVTFDFFNLKYKKYMSLKNGPFQLTVVPGDESDKENNLSSLHVPEELKEEIQVEARDVHYIKENFYQRIRMWRAAKIALMSVDIFLAVLLGIFFIVKRRQEAADKDVVGRRRRLAIYNARRRIKELKRLEQAQDRKFFEESARIFDGYIADKGNLSPHGLTWERIEQELKRINYNEELLKEAAAFYETCNVARFASASLSKDTYKKTETLLKKIIDSIERKMQ